jgi:hypothetical protein
MKDAKGFEGDGFKSSLSRPFIESVLRSDRLSVEMICNKLSKH